MNRQTIIRGIAIAAAGISASVFAAKEMLMTGSDLPSQSLSAQTDTSAIVRGASLVGVRQAPGNPDMASKIPLVDTRAELVLEEATGDVVELETPAPPELALGALDLSLGTDAARNVTNDFSPNDNIASAEGLGGDRGAPADMVCTPRLTLEPMVDALLELRLEAPCHPMERLVISHGDLAFSAYTNAEGRFTTFMPALAENAQVDLFLPDDTFLQQTVQVPDVVEHHRVVIQWTGDHAIGLHAYHRGAMHGGIGHLSSSNPFDPELDQAFLISLGENHGPEPMLAQVYSIPTQMTNHARIELEVTHNQQHCGQDLTAYMVQTTGGNGGDVTAIELALPGCDAMAGLVIVPLPIHATTRVRAENREGEVLPLVSPSQLAAQD